MMQSMKKVLSLLTCVLAALPIRSFFSAEDDERRGEQLARAVWQASGGKAWAKVNTIDFTFVVEKRGEIVARAEHLSTCYQPLTDQSPAASGDPALDFPSAGDFSNGKLSLSDTVVEKMPTFAV
jgi:hypothetical protein